jgi:predicted DNA-binding transcriptional regulator YafY
MSDTTIRYLSMLSLIPGRPSKITARELHEKLQTEGFDITSRSIERDLHKLSQQFPLTNDEGRPAGWSWEAKDTRITFPRMDVGTALTYEFLARYLKPMLPRDMCKRLEPDFSHARQVLDALGASPLGKWSKRIAVLPPGLQLLPPNVREDVSDVTYNALLTGKQFEAKYLGLEAQTPKDFVFSPLGLVYRQSVLYLVATLWDYDDVRQFALHRMSNAKLLDSPAAVIKGFDLDRYIREDKSFDLPAGKIVALELIVEAWLARHLSECRLAGDQCISATRVGGKSRVTATVADSEQLYWWLCSFGTNLEVSKPASLRRRMRTLATELEQRYR